MNKKIRDPKTFYFCPGSFTDIMETGLGAKLVTAIISEKSLGRMELAIDLDLPPITGCLRVLQEEVDAKELGRLRVKQFIGLVVKQYMEFLRYKPTGKICKIKKGFIRKGWMYFKKD